VTRNTLSLAAFCLVAAANAVAFDTDQWQFWASYLSATTLLILAVRYD
jgi:hypothetical protein